MCRPPLLCPAPWSWMNYAPSQNVHDLCQRRVLIAEWREAGSTLALAALIVHLESAHAASRATIRVAAIDNGIASVRPHGQSPPHSSRKSIGSATTAPGAGYSTSPSDLSAPKGFMK